MNKANRARKAPLQPFPRSIRVGNRRYSIDLIESMLNKGEMAKVFYEEGKIIIGKRSSLNGRRFSKADLRESFFHELVHAILYDMNAHKLNRDEVFVTEFAQRLAQTLNKVEFK